MYTVLIVEDDPIISQVLIKSLNHWKINAINVKEFDKVMETFTNIKPHLVVMDIHLPFYNGYYWTMEIRKISKVPIIFVSSNDMKMDMVMAMNMGGDDYIVKPFDLEVAVAKIQAMLRRTYDFNTVNDYLEHRGLVLEIGTTKATYHSKEVDLTKNEYRILLVLLENKEKCVSRDILMQKLWDDESFIDDNTLTVNVTRLKKKLVGIGLENFIMTKKGLGYMIE